MKNDKQRVERMRKIVNESSNPEKELVEKKMAVSMAEARRYVARRREKMKDDKAHLRLTIDVHYEMGRTNIQDLEKVLVNAADHLADEGLLSGETEASVLTWDSTVSTPDTKAKSCQRHILATTSR